MNGQVIQAASVGFPVLFHKNMQDSYRVQTFSGSSGRKIEERKSESTKKRVYSV